jgi:glucose/arabinose dehydrogenase
MLMFHTCLSAGATQTLTADLPHLPQGFSIGIWNEQVPGARSMALARDGTVYVGSMETGSVYALRDLNGDGEAETRSVILDGLNGPNGVAILDDDLYIAEINRLLRIRHIAHHQDTLPQPEVLIGDLPGEQHHGARYLRAGPDGFLYMSLGAPCNVCQPSSPLGSILRIDPEGRILGTEARGVRNSMGFDWDPVSGKMFFTDNGRDLLGDDIPREELNRIDRSGDHFGFPWCHAGTIQDPEWKQQPCDAFKPPVWTFPAHTAPLAVHFYRGNMFPASYQHRAFVAQHGSWNRTEPDGYRMVTLEFMQGQPVSEQPFLDGWRDARNSGERVRPVDMLELADGSLLVSDDNRGAIYRIAYHPPLCCSGRP